MPLLASADKKTQIAFINKMEQVVQALLDYANGDESALDAINNHLGEPATQVAPQQTLPIEKSNVVQMPQRHDIPLESKCVCPMAVKDKDSATHLCLLCGKNAYETKYVFSHMPAGIALRKGDVDAANAILYPETGIQPMHYITADGIEFLESTEEDTYDGEEEV